MHPKNSTQQIDGFIQKHTIMTRLLVGLCLVIGCPYILVDELYPENGRANDLMRNQWKRNTRGGVIDFLCLDSGRSYRSKNRR